MLRIAATCALSRCVYVCVIKSHTHSLYLSDPLSLSFSLSLSQVAHCLLTNRGLEGLVQHDIALKELVLGRARSAALPAERINGRRHTAIYLTYADVC
jgi:hypothetical protein